MENQQDPPAKKRKGATTTQMSDDNEIGNTEGSHDHISRSDDILKACLAFFESSSDSDEDSTHIDLVLKVHKTHEKNALLLIQGINLLAEKTSRNCVKNYFDTYPETEFRRHFRISRSLYDSLCEGFAESNEYKSLRVDKRLSEKLHVAVFLWFAGHEACSYRDLADRFDLSLGTICNVIRRVTSYISSLSPEIIKWPNAERKLETSQYFAEKCGFSKAIGCIDGTHIIIDPPKTNKDDYIDRKGNTTICLQGICDENKKFISIFVGYPGSSHDSWVFQNSPIFNEMTSLCGEYYLLGDSAYPCSSHCITPYGDNGNLTNAQKEFNVRLSRGRVAIKHTFEILKQRFRQLYYCKIRGIKHLCHFIRACCVLHNIANECDLDFDLIDTDREVTEDPEHRTIEAQRNAARDAVLKEIEINCSANIKSKEIHC